MMKIIKGLHYGKPVDAKQGILYLMLRSFKWKVDQNTNRRILNRHWIGVGNSIRVQDTVMGKLKNNSIYAIRAYTGEQAEEINNLVAERGGHLKSVISARNPHNPKRVLINHTLRKMYNFYINHLHEAKDIPAEAVVCAKTPQGKLRFRFMSKK